MRRDGWIDPSEAAVKLPELIDAVSSVNRKGMIITSDVNDADHPDVTRVLEHASKLGVRYFRMAYYKYDFTKKISAATRRVCCSGNQACKSMPTVEYDGFVSEPCRSQLCGAPLWDLMEVLKGIDPKAMSIALDLRHTTIEAAESWRASYSRVRESVGAIFAKDAIYVDGKINDGPLGRSEKGKKLFELIQADHSSIPISLHMEYIDHRKPELMPQRLEAITADVQTLKGWLKASKNS